MRALRAETGWSQVYLAALLHTTDTAIARYETGKQPIEGLVGAYFAVIAQAVAMGRAATIETAVRQAHIAVFYAVVDAARGRRRVKADPKRRPYRKRGPRAKRAPPVAPEGV